MTFLTALGGLSQGISQGISDLNEQKRQKALEEQQAFQKTQNERLLAQQAEENRVNTQLKGIQRTAPDQWGAGYEGANNNAVMRDDNGNLMPGVKAGAARPEHEIMLDKAKILMDSSNRNDQIFGRQLMQQAQEEQELSGVKTAQEKFQRAQSLLHSDMPAFLKEYGDQFNKDQIGGPAVQGVKANVLNTPNGKVVSIVGPDQTVMHQIPATKEHLGRALRSMYMEELAGVSPKYAALAMENEKLGLQRQANETDAQYKNRMANVYENRNAIDEKEMKGKLALWGAQAKKVGQEMEGFQQFLGQDDQGRIHGVLKNGKLGTIEAPLNKDGTPIELMPKFTGAKGVKKSVTIKPDAENNLVAFDSEGHVVHNVIAGGLEVPPGITTDKYNALETKAKQLGVQMHLGKDSEGYPTIGYLGQDGQYYHTPEEALKAKVKPTPVPK
jgi:hypothetical protein